MENSSCRTCHWKTLVVLVGVPLVLYALLGLCGGGVEMALSIPLFLIGGAPYFVVMGIRELVYLNPYGVQGSTVWMLVVGLSYLIHLSLLVGVVIFQKDVLRAWCVVTIVAAWIFAFWSFTIWAAQSC